MIFTAMPSRSFLTTNGQDIELFPILSELTVSQAATYLDGSEGLINELLDAGLITFRLENGERLVQRNSLLNYAQEERCKLAAANELFRTFQEAGLSDDYD